MGEWRSGQNLILRLLGFPARVKRDHVGAYAAKAAYFLILSFVPFILFLTTLVRYTPLTYNTIREVIIGFVPQNLQGYVLEIVADIYRISDAVVPISAVTALWSAGKGLQAIINGLNTIYHVKETRNWLVTRIYAVFYTLLFVIALIVSLLLLVLGTQIQILVAGYVPFLGRILARIIGARNLLAFCVLFLIFLVLYRVLPNRRATFKSQVPGALITAVAWLTFSYFFSLYFELFPGTSNMYGNMTAVPLVMLWMYICMNLMLYGAEINAYFELEFRLAQASVRDMLNRDKTKEEEE